MTDRYQPAVDGGFRFSPLWHDEVAVFNPASTEILVVAPLAARVLQAVQANAPATLDAVCEALRSDPQFAGTDELRSGVDALLIEFERLGLVESRAP